MKCRSVPFIKVIVDLVPWFVSGTHYERTSADGALNIEYSHATGCNRGDTFNSMGES